MSYNRNDFQNYVQTAGKITILTAFLGVVVFTLVFLLNIGAKEFKHATAQVATTTITVLNTPPSFIAGPFESPESSTSSPTNSGDTVTWVATGQDPSGQDYYFLVCDGETASPTANAGAAPTCGAGDNAYGVSALASSGVQATVSTTTYDGDPTESFPWFAWVCDAEAVNPRCNAYAQQGTGSTSSPFNVNHRPAFTGYWNDSPADPGADVTFYATSTDIDVDATQDTVQLHICSTNSFNTVTDSCDVATLATSSFTHPNAVATYTIPSIYQDDDYDAYAFIIDVHGHEASGGSQGTGAAAMTVNNVAPQVLTAGIDLITDGSDITPTEGIQSTGYTLEFEVTDANSCDAVGGANSYDEFSTSTISVYRSGIGSTTCDGTNSGNSFNENNCYESGVGTSRWNLQCTASSTTCTGSDDDTITVECTFPLWYIIDPTSGADASSTVYFAEDWRAGVSATDDDFATSSFTESTVGNPEVNAVTAINLLDTSIPYGPLEPGQDTGAVNASTTVESTGNTGLNENLSGQDMCNTYATGQLCDPSATHTIPAAEQEYSSTTFTYGAGTDLSSTTPAELDINIPKTTSTTTANNAETYWGISVPASITFAGSYTGENTFTAAMSDPSLW